MKILIIEDTREVSDFLEVLISRWGHQPRTAATGKDAIGILKEEMFELVLLDIFLPDTVAYDLIPSIKAAWSGINIITMTGQSTREVEERVRGEGILYYMVKPVESSELKAVIDHLVKNQDDPHRLENTGWFKDMETYFQ